VQHGRVLALWMAAILIFLALTRAWLLRLEGGWVSLNRARREDSSMWRQLNGLRRADFYLVALLSGMACLCLVMALATALE
jgi:hypothetical protein